MQKNNCELLSDELWSATYPMLKFYVRFIAPLFLACFGYFAFKVWKADLLNNIYNCMPLLCVVLYTYFHWRSFCDLKNKRQYDVGVSQAVKVGDSIDKARFSILLAIFAHLMVVVGFTGFYVRLIS